MASECILCGEEFAATDDVSKLTTKGLETLISSSILRNDGLAEKLQNTQLPQTVHKDCRKKYTRPSSIKSSKDQSHSPSNTESKNLRSCEKKFDFKQDCLFCGENANVTETLKRKKRVVKVETIEFRENVLKRAKECDDEVGQTVLARVQSCIDLVAAEAQYHDDCRRHFFLHSMEGSNKRSRGRPEDKVKSEAFLKLCNYIDTNDDECQYSLAELLDLMDMYLDGKEGYTTKSMQSKLMEHYGDQIIITSIPGKASIVCFKDSSHSILHENWYKSKCTDPTNERKRIVETAASIIREDIRLSVYNYDTYPASSVINEADCLVPDTLQCFMKGILKCKGQEQTSVHRRCTAISHALINACRPRSFISPLLLATGVYIHRKYASRELIDILSSLGFAVNYKEVQRYEYSMMAGETPSYDLNGFVQFIFDNADFNVHSLDGHNTFHSMGGIASVTPSVSTPSHDVPRIRNIPSASTLETFGSVQFKTFNAPAVPALKSISVKDVTLRSENETGCSKSVYALNLLWLIGYYINASPCPSWSGFMLEALKMGIFDTSRIVVLPFINEDPNNLSTIYSALHFAQNLCDKYGISICPVTFDQPLYIKAVGIVAASNDLKKVFVRLGGFHLLMSFMGSVGNIMAGSGLEELWESVYAKGSVVHMMNGHAYSRALRAHFLTQVALAQILLQSTSSVDDLDTDRLKYLYESLLVQEVDIDHVIDEPCITELIDKIEKLCHEAAGKGRTATLWINYFKQVSIMRLFIYAERTGNWWLHLESVRQMLPYFHAAGHLAYAKSAHLYVQQMMDLKNIMSETEYNQFTDLGYFTIRRTDKFWSGVFSDQTIEQFLMRQLKTSGGMTRGRGITSSTLTKWVHALPQCVPICNALETFTSVHTGTSEQHKDLRPASQSRDKSDIDCFIQWLQAHPPFVSHQPDILCSVSTGIIADETVNCDNAVQLGQLSMKKMLGKNYSELTLHRKDKVKSLAAMKNTVKIRGEDKVINPALMFNRITCILNTSTEMENFLQYELAPQPPSLFQDGQIRKTDKSALGKMMKSLTDCQNTIPSDAIYIIDGGFLLHAVVWPKPATYQKVCESYKTYIIKHYHENSIVVFDGYNGPPSTKSAEQNRRSKSCTSSDIIVSLNLPTTTSQSAFLGNNGNKSRLIDTLTPILESSGITVKQAESDADTLIVSTAFQVAEMSGNDHQVMVVGTDTDILVMMVARATSSMNLFMLTHRNPLIVYSIARLQQALGNINQHLLVVHAMTGCDTTSALYGQGKVKALKLAQKQNTEVVSQMNVFISDSSTPEDIATAGEKIILALYGADQFSTLNKYRYIAYKRSVAKASASGSFTLASLPPTSSAARYHSYRVYLQVQEWLGNSLAPSSWGWKIEQNNLIPITSDQPSAPDTLLNLVSCACRTGCGNACGCRKGGMVCSDICSNCMGETCSNTAVRSLTDED